MDFCTTPYTPINAQFNGEEIIAMHVSASGKELVTSSQNEVRIWQLPAIRLQCLASLEENIASVAFQSRRNRLVAIAEAPYDPTAKGYRERVLTWDMNQKGAHAWVDFPTTQYYPSVFRLSPSGSHVAYFEGTAGGKVWDWEHGQLPLMLDGCEATEDYVFTHDGAFIAAIQDGCIVIWEACTGRQNVAIQEQAVTICFTPDRSLAVSTVSSGIVFYRYDGRHWTRTWNRKLSQKVVWLDSNDTQMLAVLITEGVVMLETGHGSFCGSMQIDRDDTPFQRLITVPQQNLLLIAEGYGTLLAVPYQP